ncbi:cupin [Corynebacterium sp. YIM 101645]|uniref:Cupin n=1 Tax=Corynebacterium lemuris TaxID=1859292 RepID=A0ABT2FZA7_9CORY|nr:cupin [Corynebacterium lemuris]MCS5480065.1 cupin [Corynebacterium lemuris]
MSIVDDKARQLLEEACASEHGRAAKMLVNDGPLRQTVIAMREGTMLQEHNSPPAASIFLFSGQVTVKGQAEETIGEGQLVTLTHQRHSVSAIKDSVFLLTTVTNVEGQGSHDGE